MSDFIFTTYFENDMLQKRPYIKKEWCECVVLNHIKVEIQDNGRFRIWAFIKEFDNRALRVVTLEDQKTIHNAFFDRNFKSGG